MKNDTISKDMILCRVIQRMHVTEKKTRSDYDMIKDSTEILESINKVLKDQLHTLRLKKINEKIMTFKFTQFTLSDLQKTIYECILVLDNDLDEKDQHEDLFSATEDELF